MFIRPLYPISLLNSRVSGRVSRNRHRSTSGGRPPVIDV